MSTVAIEPRSTGGRGGCPCVSIPYFIISFHLQILISSVCFQLNWPEYVVDVKRTFTFPGLLN